MTVRPARWWRGPINDTPRCSNIEDTLNFFSRTATGAQLLNIASWPKYGLRLARQPDWAAFFTVFADLASGLEHVVHVVFNGWHAFDSALVRKLTRDVREFQIGEHVWYVGQFGQAPVIWSTQFSGHWIWSPLPFAELLAQMIDGPSRITVTEEGVHVASDIDPPDTLDGPTRECIELTRRTPGPRSWLFYGPPGSGKTTAARQVAAAIGESSRIILGPGALASSDAWELVHTVKPAAIILDEVDGAAEKSLLTNLERAREYVEVIVQTANTLDLRGALMRPGRTDEAPRLYDRCHADTAKLIAPTVPVDILSKAIERGLLPAYLAELESRHAGGRDLAEAVDELLERQSQIGER